ncbi:MAG: hypothetical protein WC806_06690 [Candidatus Gracilibacteria bacterium]|jgi:hypothetical protein
MKNKLLIFSLASILFLQTSCVFAENLISWQEICPAQYQNVKYHHQFYKTQMTLGVLLCASLFGLGPGIAMLAITSEVQDKNYWALRKKEYDKEVAACDSFENKTMCYMQIREDELSKNQEHNLSTSKNSKSFNKSNYY